MEDFSHLKYISRSPLPLHRIPTYLSVQIISKQSAATVYNLALTNSSSSILVEKVLSRNPQITAVRELLEHDKDELLTPEKMPDLLPLTRYSFLYPRQSFYNWKVGIGTTAISCRLNEITREAQHKTFSRKRTKALVDKVQPFLNLCTSNLSKLWEAQRLVGPQQIRLQSIPVELWKKILPKASAVSATRLARTQSTVATVLNEYIESKITIKIMEKYSNHLLKRKNTGLKAELFSFLRHISYMQQSFYSHTLIGMNIDDGLWLRKPRFTEEEKSALGKIKASYILRKTKEKEEAQEKFRLLGACKKQVIRYKLDNCAFR